MVDRCYHRDINTLNNEYLTLLKKSLIEGATPQTSLVCKSSALQFLKNYNSIHKIAACNVLQYRILLESRSIDSDQVEQQDSRLAKLLRNTLFFYREVSITTPKMAETITGMPASVLMDFANRSYTDIDEILKEGTCGIQMRFFDTYWERVKDIASDGEMSFNLITASHAANETYARTLKGEGRCKHGR